MSDNIEVVVRVRPLLPRENGDTIHWKVVSDKNSLIQVTAVDKSSATYVFDRVYDTSSTNGEVFQAIVQPIVAGALNGINGTVFAYGQTSSGKTHTMMGDESNPGIIPLTIRSIFQGIEDTPDRQYLVRASYMEIYNEQIADLLAGRSNIPGNKGLAVREDGSGLIYVAELKEECVTDESKLLSIMHRGDRNRQVGCTNMNDRSSRSHTIFRIIVESQCAVDGDESVGNGEDEMAVTVSHLNLVDLAGSENAAQTGATGDRLKEGGYINKSLFMLGRVISQLSDGESYVNYRDSKLTRILQCSLGGNARTAIICTVTPVTVDQTHSTLRFASRAKNIKNKPIVNEVLSEAALLKRYSKEINLLKTALERERLSNRADEVLQVKEKLDEVEQMNEDLKSKVRKLNEKLVTSSICRTPKRADKKSKSSRRETWAAPFQKSRTTLLPLDLASINAKFSAPFFPPSSVAPCGGKQKRSMLPVINETPSVSDCSFATAAEEFYDTNSSFMRRLDQSAINRLDSSVLDSSGTEVFPITCATRPKVSFASPALADETLEDDAFHQPQANNITKRRRGGRQPPPKVYLDAEVQTDDTLAPKLKRARGVVLGGSARSEGAPYSNPPLERQLAAASFRRARNLYKACWFSLLHSATGFRGSNISSRPLPSSVSLLCSPRTSRRAVPSPSTPDRSMNRSLLFPGSPAGETPRMALRARISKLSSVLSEKDGRVDELKQELQELQELHNFVEADYRFREESLLAKLDEEPADVQLQDMSQQVTSLKRSLHDSEGLLMDANKRLSHQTQKVQCQALELEQLRTENTRLEAVCKDSAEVKARCCRLQTDHDRLVKELHEKRDSLNVLEKDRQDFNIMLELRLEKQQRIERDLRRSLEEAWSDLAKMESGDVGVVKARLERTANLEIQLRERDAAIKELEEQIIRSSELELQKIDLEEALKIANDDEGKYRLNLASKEAEIELLKSKLLSNAIEEEVIAGPGAPTEASPPQAISSFVDNQHVVLGTLLAGVTNDNNRLALAASDNNLQEHQEAIKEMLPAATAGQVESLTLKCKELEGLLACKEELCTELSNKVNRVLGIQKNATHQECTEINISQPAAILSGEESMEVDPVEEEKPSLTLANNCTNCDTLENLLKSLKRECHEREVEKGSTDCTECEKLTSSMKEQEIANKELVGQMDAMKSTIADFEVEIEALKCSLQNAIKVDSSNTVSNCGVEMKDEQAKSDLHSRNTSLNVDDNLKAHSDINNATLIVQLKDITTESKEEKKATIPSASNETLAVLELNNAVLETRTRELEEQIVYYLDQQRLQEVRVEELDKALSSLGEEKVELLLKLEDESKKEAQKIQQILENAEQERANLSTQRLLLEKSLSLATEEIASLKEQLSAQQAQEDAHRTAAVEAESLKTESKICNVTSVSDQCLGGLEQLNTEKMSELAHQIAKLKFENERLCEELEEIESLNLDHMSLKQEIEEMTEEVEQLRENKKCILKDDSVMEKTELGKGSSEPLANEMRDSGLIESAQSNLQDELDELKCEKQKLQCRVEELSARLTNNLDEATVKDREVVKLNKENKELMMEMEELKALNCRESYELSIEELNAQIISREQDNAELLAEVQALRKVNTQKLQVDVELETLVNQHANLKLQRDKLLLNFEESKANESCSTAESLKKEILDLTQEKLSLTSELKTMRARLCSDSGAADLNKLTEEVETNSTEKRKLFEMIANLPKGVSVDNASIFRSALNEDEIVVLRQQLEAFEKSKIEMNSELQEVDRLKNELIVKLQEASSELEETTSQKHELIVKLQEASSELEETTSQKHELIAKLQEASSELEETTSQKHELIAKLQEVSSELEETTSQKHELIAKLQEVSSELEETTSQKHELIAKLQEVSSELEETTSQKHELIAKLQEVSSELEETTSQKHELIAKLQGVSSELEEMTSQKHELIAKLQEVSSELEEKTSQKHELIAKLQGVSSELEEMASQNQKLRVELLETKRSKHELDLRLENLNHQRPKVLGVSHDNHEQMQQQQMAEVQELTREKDALVSELREINCQKQDLLAELQQLSRRRNALLDETDDLQTTLLAAATSKRRSSAPRRRGSSVSTLRDESCLLQDSIMAYTGDDTLSSGPRSTKAALSAASHRLLHTLTLFEESVVQPALDRTDINATAPIDRTVSSEEFSAEQLQEVRDQLLELQRALLAASLSETSSALPSSGDCCLIFAENEVECHTLRLLESIASDYIAHSCQIYSLTKNISAVGQFGTASYQTIPVIRVFDASIDNPRVVPDQSQSLGIDKHAQLEQTSSECEDATADRVTHVNKSIDVTSCPEMFDAADCDVTMGVTLRDDLFGRRSRLFDSSFSDVGGSSLNTSRRQEKQVLSLAEEMKMASADDTFASADSILAHEPLCSKDVSLRPGTAPDLADELRLADLSGNKTVSLVTNSVLSLADELGFVDISSDNTRNRETNLVPAYYNLLDESSTIETSLLTDRCVTSTELAATTHKSQNTVIDTALDGQNMCSDDLLKELDRVRKENTNLVEEVEVLSLALEQHKNSLDEKMFLLAHKEGALLDQTEPVKACQLQFDQNLLKSSENDNDVMVGHSTEDKQNTERYSSNVSDVQYDDADVIMSANENQLFDQSVNKGSIPRGYSERDDNTTKDSQNLTTEELLQKIDEQEAANASLRSKLSEANLVVEEVHCLRWQANDLEEQKKALDLEIEELKDALQESGRTTPSGIDDNIEDKDNTQAEKNDTCKNTVEDQPEPVITTDELESRFEGVFKKLDNKETKLESFESQVSSLEEIVKLQASSSSDENRLVNSQQLYRVLAEKHRLAVELKKLKESADALEDREALADSLDKVLEQFSEKEYEVALLTRKIDDTNEHLAVRTAMLESITSKYEDHMLECALQQVTLGDKENKQREEEAKLLLLLAEKEAVLHDVSGKLNEQNLQVSNLEKKLDSTITNTNEAVDKLKETLLTKDVLISELNQKICEVETNKTELEDNVGFASQRLQTELKLREDNLLSLSSQLVQVKDELNAVGSAKEEVSNLVKACLEKVTSVLDNPNCVGSSNPAAEFVELLDALLASFETKCDELKQSTTAVQNLHIIVDKKTKEVESAKGEHAAEIQKLLQILESKESAVRDTVETLEKAKIENEAQLKHQLSLKINQLQQIELTAEELEQELKLKEEHIENLMIQINSYETKISQMTEDMNVFSSKMNEMKVESNKKIEVLEKMSSELSSLKESRCHLETLREQLQDGHLAYQELEAKLADSILKQEDGQATLETLKNKCTALELCADSALKQAEQCKIQNGDRVKEIDRLNSVVEKHEVEISEKDAKSKAIEFEHSLCKKIMDEKVSTLGEVESLHSMCAEKLSSAKRELDALQAEHSLCIQKLSEKDMKMSAIQTVHMKCEKSLSDKDDRFASTEEELKRTLLLASQTSTKLGTLEKEHSECANKLKVLRGEMKYFDHLEKEVSMLKLKLSEQEQASALLSQECDKYIKRAEEMKLTLQEHEASKNVSVEQLQHKFDACQMTTDQLRMECQQMQVKYDELRASAQCVEKIYELWHDSQRDQFVENVVKLHKSRTGRGCCESVDADDQAVVDKLRQEVADLKQRLQSKEDEYKQLDEELNETVEHFEQRIAGYVADRGVMPSKIFDLTQENDKYKAEINQLTKKLKRLEHNVDLFKKEKNDLEESFGQAMEQLKSQKQASSVASPASSADSEQWNARVQALEAQVKQCQELLTNTESERKRLDEELDETVAHYEKRIADCVAQQHAEATQAEQMREQSRRDTEEKAKLNSAMEQLRREKLELQQTLQETVEKLENQEKLSTPKKASDSHRGSQNTMPGLSSCDQRAARQQQLAHFDSRSQLDREMTELKDRLHFAETHMSRYRDELRRLQNSGPLNNTICQLQSSKPAQSRVQREGSAANSPVHGFEGGSHIVMSELVTDLKRDVYQLEKENKALKGEVNSITQHLTHYKTKAQEWKTSSLLHQKHTAKLKTEIQSLKCEIERLKKRVEKIPASVQKFDSSVLSQHVLDTVSRAKNDHLLLSPLPKKDGALETADFHSQKVLQETNRIRNDPIQYDVLIKTHKKTENIPPSHDIRPAVAAPLSTYQHTSPTLLTKTSASSSSNLRGGAANISPVTRSIAGTTGLVTRTVSGSALTHTSPDTRVTGALTGSAAIIKGMRGDEAQRGSWDDMKPSSHGTDTEDSCPKLTASVTRSGKPLRRNWETVKSSNAKYFLPDDKPKQKEDCKTQ